MNDCGNTEYLRGRGLKYHCGVFCILGFLNRISKQKTVDGCAYSPETKIKSGMSDAPLET